MNILTIKLNKAPNVEQSPKIKQTKYFQKNPDTQTKPIKLGFLNPKYTNKAPKIRVLKPPKINKLKNPKFNKLKNPQNCNYKSRVEVRYITYELR